VLVLIVVNCVARTAKQLPDRLGLAANFLHRLLSF
jgi:hypothetical protein